MDEDRRELSEREKEQMLRRRIARDTIDRSRVQVMRDGRPDINETARIWTNNNRSDAMQQIGARHGLRDPETETDPRRRQERRAANYMTGLEAGMKKGGVVKMAAGGKVRGDGVCSKGKTKGRFV